MRSRSGSTLFCLLTMVGLISTSTGCVSLNKPYQQTYSYTLEYQLPNAGNQTNLPTTLRVENFGASSAYNSNRILYRDTSFTRNAYIYHKWRSNPAAMIRDLLERDLRNSGAYKAVLHRENRLPADFSVEGQVEEMLEWDTAETWEAVLAIQITLIDNRRITAAEKIVFQQTFTARKNCRAQSPQALAGAMSEAMAEISDRILATIYQHIGNPLL